MKINKNLIKTKLEAQGLTQEEAADKFRIRREAFRVIMAYGNCDGINLGKIAKGLGVAVWELVDK